MILAVDILKLFRQRKQYIGIVVDEFGSFEGIVSLHDLNESIIMDPGFRTAAAVAAV